MCAIHDEKTNSYSFKPKGQSYTLAPLLPCQILSINKADGVENTSEKALCFRETRVERSINKGKSVFALFVLEKGEKETTLHPLAQPLIHEFGDVFATGLSLGLPPIREIEHHIDLLPEASLLTN